MLEGGGIFINGIGMTSAMGFGKNSLLIEKNTAEKNLFKISEPDYTGFISPQNLRRMSRLLKISLATAIDCLREAGIEMPYGIITGTGLGCMEDTEKFLQNIIEHEGVMAQPTSFIHSTHNTISSQIAIALKCTGYNSTYVHRFISFESALLDCWLQLKEDYAEKNVLVGGADEMSEVVNEVMGKLNCWKKTENKEELYKSNSAGTVGGEGCAFFMLSNKKSLQTYAEIKSIEIINVISNYDELENALNNFLSLNKLNAKDIDLLMMGNNGDARYDHFYHFISQKFSANTTIAYFKYLSGEFFTSSAFGLSFTTMAIKNNFLPNGAIIKQGESKNFKNIIFYNQSMGHHHCFYLLNKIDK